MPAGGEVGRVVREVCSKLTASVHAREGRAASSVAPPSTSTRRTPSFVQRPDSNCAHATQIFPPSGDGIGRSIATMESAMPPPAAFAFTLHVVRAVAGKEAATPPNETT